MIGPVLVTNDDGIKSKGIIYLVEELSKKGFDVYVVAPKNQVSGAGKSHSFNVKVEKCEMDFAKEAWCVEGKPADAVAIGIKYLLNIKPKLIVSGINIGPNMGLMDFFTSGTIGGALEGILLGYKALSSSFAVLRGIKSEEQENLLKSSARITAEISLIALELFEKDNNVDLINLNFPSINPFGIKVTKLSWLSNIDVKEDSSENVFNVMGWKTDNLDEAYKGGDIGSDVEAVKKGYISVTPICVRCMPEKISYVNSFEFLERNLNKIKVAI